LIEAQTFRNLRTASPPPAASPLPARAPRLRDCTLPRRARCKPRTPQYHRYLVYFPATMSHFGLKVPRQEITLRYSLHALPQVKLSMPLPLGRMPQKASIGGREEASRSHGRLLPRRPASVSPQLFHFPPRKAASLPLLPRIAQPFASLSPHQGHEMRLLVLTLPPLFEKHSQKAAKTPDFFSFRSSEEEGIPQLVFLGRSEGDKSPRSWLFRNGPAPELRQSQG
jgi:hypothetical protein